MSQVPVIFVVDIGQSSLFHPVRGRLEEEDQD